MALCPTCLGRLPFAIVDVPAELIEDGICPPGAKMWSPCPQCWGSGIVHCCEGERAQPEAPASVATKVNPE